MIKSGDESRIVDGYLKRIGIDKYVLKDYEYDMLNYIYLICSVIQIDLVKASPESQTYSRLKNESKIFNEQLTNEVSRIRERIRKESNG